MNDLKDEVFAFGKVESGEIALGVINDTITVEHLENQNDSIRASAPKKHIPFLIKLNNALDLKRAAVSTLEDLRISKLCYSEYCTIRDALESLSEIVENDKAHFEKNHEAKSSPLKPKHAHKENPKWKKSAPFKNATT